MLTDVVIANKSYAKLNVPEDHTPDPIAIKVIKQDCPDFLLPMKTLEIDGSMEIRYELTEGIRLSYMPGKMDKNSFITMMIQMLSPFEICNDWFLDYHNFLLDEDYILIRKNGGMVKYVYLPSKQYRNSEEKVKDFFSKIILKTDITDAPGYMVNPLRILNSQDSTLLTLLDHFKKEEGAETVKAEEETSATKPPDDRFVEKPKDNPVPKPERKEEPPKVSQGVRPGQSPNGFGQNDDAGRLMENLFGESAEIVEGKKGKKGDKKQVKEKQGGIFKLFKGKSKPEIKPDSLGENLEKNQFPEKDVSVPLRPSQPLPCDYEEATIIEEAGTGSYCLLRLCLESCSGCECPKVIELDLEHGFITVGRLNKRGEEQADFNFDASLSFVSRRHFRVEKGQGTEQWNIIDLESTNGTYVNGTRLHPNISYGLNRNDTIMISGNRRHLIYRIC